VRKDDDDFFGDFNRQTNRMFGKVALFGIAVWAVIIALIAVAVIVVLQFV
jgi:hypothetical protein